MCFVQRSARQAHLLLSDASIAACWIFYSGVYSIRLHFLLLYHVDSGDLNNSRDPNNGHGWIIPNDGMVCQPNIGLNTGLFVDHHLFNRRLFKPPSGLQTKNYPT